ncbi:MAG: hypothetical protein FWG15_07965 [Propionibacteriaceae bacterium]|nr:hypothetical protein [Propionibacteriaceae bacterium]
MVAFTWDVAVVEEVSRFEVVAGLELDVFAFVSVFFDGSSFVDSREESSFGVEDFSLREVLLGDEAEDFVEALGDEVVVFSVVDDVLVSPIFASVVSEPLSRAVSAFIIPEDFRETVSGRSWSEDSGLS